MCTVQEAFGLTDKEFEIVKKRTRKAQQIQRLMELVGWDLETLASKLPNLTIETIQEFNRGACRPIEDYERVLALLKAEWRKNAKNIEFDQKPYGALPSDT